MNPAIITIDKNGIVQNIDKNCTSLFGYEPEEFVGKPVKMIIPSPYNEQHDDYIANYLKTGRERMIGKTREVEGLHKDGSIISIKLSVMKVGDGDGVTFVGILHKVEEDVVVITCTEEGTILQSTNTTRRFLGYTSEELVGSDISSLIPLSDQDDHHRYLRNYLNGKQNEFIGCPRNLTAESKSGAKIPICLSLENVGIGPNTEQFFKATIHKVDMMTVFTVSGNDGKIRSCSPCVRNLLGYSQVELVGSSIASIAPIFFDDESNTCRRNSCEEPNRKRQKIFISGSVCLDSVPIKWLTGSFNNTILHKDGSCIAAIIRVFPFEHNSETLYSVQMKRAEDPFNSSQELKCIGDYVLGKTIGRGSFGKVKLGTHKSSGLKVAIKILQKAFISAERVSRTRMEIEMLRNLQHPNITKLYQVIETDESLNLVLELAGGTLQAAIPPNGFSEPEAIEIFVQIVSAVKYCHDNRIIHRDLKGDNILISNGVCKIIDFGLGNFVKDGELRTTFCGTPAFAAPEMILGKRYDGPEVDIWSLGVILFCLVTGNYPFEKIEDVLNCKYVIPDKISDSCRDLIRRILESDIPSRITLSGMCSHVWLKARFDFYESRISTSPIFRSSSSSICSISRSSSSLKLEEGESTY